MQSLLNIALSYHYSGLRVIPVGKNKRPACKWKQYQNAQTEQDVIDLFKLHDGGIAVLTGVDGLECIDIDVKHDIKGTLVKDFAETYARFGKELGNDFVVQKTVNGGLHLFYKCDKNEGNLKLASRPATDEELQKHNQIAKRKITDPYKLPEVLIETRGIGGYVLVYPSNGYSIARGKLTNIPKISAPERYNLFAAAREFDEIVKAETNPYDVPEIPNTNDGQLTPWDDYNERGDVIQLLKNHGWQIVSTISNATRTYFKRPGNTDAKQSGNYHHGKKLFLAWTTSSVFEAGAAYTNWSVYKELEHGGNKQAAARELYRLGYGERYHAKQKNGIVAKNTSVKNVPKKINVSELIQKAEKTKYDYNRPIVHQDICLYCKLDGVNYKIGGKGMIGVFIGQEKSGKSYTLSCIASSFLLKGQNVLNFSLDLQGKSLLFFDNEQSLYFYQLTQKRIYDLALIRDNKENYQAYHLRKFSSDERKEIIKHYVYNTPNLGAIILDGYVDLVGNYNDLEESKLMMEELMKWSDELNILIMGVLHVNKGDGKLRGHLGTELKNKADFVINTSKTDEGYKVSNPTSRFRAFPNFEYQRDDDNMPLLDSQEEPDYDTKIDEGNYYQEYEELPEKDPTRIQRAYNEKSEVNEEIPF